MVYMGAIYMHIDCVYGCYIQYILIVYIGAYLYACILMVCMGVIYMYIDGVYGCYIHVY
jgi:hypothetical protein